MSINGGMNMKNIINEIKKPVSSCYGITNKCSDGEYVLFADYDKVYFHVLLEELTNIFEKHKDKLTPFLILESSESISTKNGTLGSYHVISFGKLPYHEMREILSGMSVDDAFYNLPKNTPYRANTLRISPKFEWKERFDQNDVPVGVQHVLTDAPKFLCWHPDVVHIPGVKVSEAHLKAYKLMIDKLQIPLAFVKWNFDGQKDFELKQYDSLKA